MKETKDNTCREQIIALRQGDASADVRKDYWSADDRELLKKMFLDGDGITDMALNFRRSETAIVTQLNTMGMFKRSRASRRKEPDCLCPKCERYPDCAKCRERILPVSTSNS
ncbi:MAG: hypothetical protein HDT20_02235 [Oscillibacter sp.]|nr:hypothetical protein [Oscillibacter sp.]